MIVLDKRQMNLKCKSNIHRGIEIRILMNRFKIFKIRLGSLKNLYKIQIGRAKDPRIKNFKTINFKIKRIIKKRAKKHLIYSMKCKDKV